MNTKGTTFFLILMLAVVFFFLGLGIAPALNETVGEARTDADCDNSSISDFEKGGCVIMDLTSPYFIAVIFALAGAILGGIIIFT